MIEVHNVYLQTDRMSIIVDIYLKGKKGEFHVIYDLKNKGIIKVGDVPLDYPGTACFTKDEFQQVCDVIEKVDSAVKEFHKKLEDIMNKKIDKGGK